MKAGVQNFERKLKRHQGCQSWAQQILCNYALPVCQGGGDILSLCLCSWLCTTSSSVQWLQFFISKLTYIERLSTQHNCSPSLVSCAWARDSFVTGLQVNTVLHTGLFLSFSSISHVCVLFASSIRFFALISAHLVHQRVLWRHLQHNLWESCFDLVAGYHSRALQVDLMDLMFTLSSCESELGATCGEGRECVEGLSNFMFDPWPEGTVSSWVISLCSLGWCPLLVAGDSCSNFHLTLFFVTPCPNVVDASVLWWECHQFPWLHTSVHLSLNA